jgi:hypothetical protein
MGRTLHPAERRVNGFGDAGIYRRGLTAARPAVSWARRARTRPPLWPSSPTECAAARGAPMVRRRGRNRRRRIVPSQPEAEAVEQAFRLVELCMKGFQRAARQLANLRLVRAKRRDRALTMKPFKAD